ncbi:sacsin N-terminal ATP-binding-like domain-containing protein [Aeromonas caviae]
MTSIVRTTPVHDREPSPADVITQLMHQRLSNYLAVRGEPSLYQSVRKMSQFVSDDYSNRFLVELIQNAHDAHDPSRTDGEIAVVLDVSEGDGCLYVANRGVGFTGNNLKAITNIALSSKPVNAGIGNKGLGFRSVLQVCNWPEIYSVQGEGGSGTFDGYCFRFASIDDLRNLLRAANKTVQQSAGR